MKTLRQAQGGPLRRAQGGLVRQIGSLAFVVGLFTAVFTFK